MHIDATMPLISKNGYISRSFSMAEKQYIRLVDRWGGQVTELHSAYELGPKKIPMYDFYHADGRQFCIKQIDAEIISAKEYFMLRLTGTEIFNND